MRAKTYGPAPRRVRRGRGTEAETAAKSPAFRAVAAFASAALGLPGWLACAAALLTTALLSACSPRLQPCRSPSACPGDEECLAQRCVPVGAEPVDPGSQRLVLEPLQVAVVRALERSQAALPPSVSLGGPSSQSEQLLLRFPEAWVGKEVSAAFLLLEPVAGAEPTAGDVEIEVALASADWSSGTAGEAPSTQSPTSAGIGRTRPDAALRIDVTALLQELATHSSRHRGLVVRASGVSERSAVYSTGADGFAPRLDVYFRPRAGAR